MTDVLAGGEEPRDNVVSIEGRAANGEHEQEPAEELFPLGSLPGDQKTLKTVFKSGLPVEVTVSLRAAEVPVRDGLVDFEKAGRVLVAYEPHKVEVVAQREEGKLVGYKVRQVLRPSHVEQVAAEAAPEAASG